MVSLNTLFTQSARNGKNYYGQGANFDDVGEATLRKVATRVGQGPYVAFIAEEGRVADLTTWKRVTDGVYEVEVP